MAISTNDVEDHGPLAVLLGREQVLGEEGVLHPLPLLHPHYPHCGILTLLLHICSKGGGMDCH